MWIHDLEDSGKTIIFPIQLSFSPVILMNPQQHNWIQMGVCMYMFMKLIDT